VPQQTVPFREKKQRRRLQKLEMPCQNPVSDLCQFIANLLMKFWQDIVRYAEAT
jgi:hypothetical protein